MLAIPFPQIDSVLLHVAGPISIKWYSLAYLFGIIIGVWLISLFYQQDTHNKLGNQSIEDLILYSTFGIIIGGRIGHVLFYDYENVIYNPLIIFKIWGGGMSFHGGLVGLTVALYLFCKKQKINFLYFSDLASCVAPIGLFLGRIANFINAELYGRETDVSWAVIFPNAGNIPRHPSQLYEAFLEGFVLFVIMMICRYKTQARNRRGLLFGVFMLFYGVFRLIIEEYREPDYHIGFVFSYFTMGQVLSLPIVFMGIYLILKQAPQKSSKN